MNWKKIWSYFEKIVYVILLIVSIEQGWWVWFVLGSTAWLCLFYHKQLYNDNEILVRYDDDGV